MACINVEDVICGAEGEIVSNVIEDQPDEGISEANPLQPPEAANEDSIEDKLPESLAESATKEARPAADVKTQPDAVSTDSGISMDSGISSGNSEGEVENTEQLFYEKPKHLNQ